MDAKHSNDDFIDDSEDRPLSKEERSEFDKLLNVFRQGVIKTRLKNDKEAKQIQKQLNDHS